MQELDFNHNTLADIPEEKVRASYEEAVEAIKEQIHALGGCSLLDERLPEIADSISLQKGETVFKGSGFGYLHGVLGGKVPSQLDFSENDDVKGWLALADGKEPETDLTFAYGVRMENLLVKNQNICNRNIPYQLSLLCYDRREFEKAKEQCEKSLILDSNAKNNHLYAHILYQLEDPNCVYFAKKCLWLQNDNYALAESIFSLLIKQGAYCVLTEEFEKLDARLQSNPRLLMYCSMAYWKSGNAKRAEEILSKNGGLKILDFREGDKFLDELYRGIRKALYGENDNEITVPEQFDFIVYGLGG